LTDKTEKWICI